MAIQFISGITDLSDRIYTASGYRRTTEEETAYTPGSVVPLLPLVPYTAEWTRDPEKAGKGHYVFVFDTKNPLFLALVKNLDIPGLVTQEETQAMMGERADSYRLFKQKFTQLITHYSASEKCDVHNVHVNEPSQLTATIAYDNINDLKCGMHFDNWSGLEVRDLGDAENRICINLGSSHRYFICANRTVFHMKDALVKLDPSLEEIQNSNEIGHLYLDRIDDPDFRIFFIKLLPLEGYIAPTECIFHDGSNFDSIHTDIQITARGFFRTDGTHYPFMEV